MVYVRDIGFGGKWLVKRLAKNPSGNRCRTFRPGFLWTARFYLNPKRVWQGIPGKSFPTIPNLNQVTLFVLYFQNLISKNIELSIKYQIPSHKSAFLQQTHACISLNNFQSKHQLIHHLQQQQQKEKAEKVAKLVSTNHNKQQTTHLYTKKKKKKKRIC